jgi:hypothetical protein
LGSQECNSQLLKTNAHIYTQMHFNKILVEIVSCEPMKLYHVNKYSICFISQHSHLHIVMACIKLKLCEFVGYVYDAHTLEYKPQRSQLRR